MKLYLLGGFLGSGKTTAIRNACLQLQKQDTGIGVITNDQGVQLVDSAFLKNLNIPNREVVNGCFCCNYSDLEKAILSIRKEDIPEILFAESVGSCADIIATVIKPLLNFHPELEVVYSVFADAANLLKMAKGEPVFFDEDINYIFEKQLEEADILVVNKTDRITENEQKEIESRLTQLLPDKSLLFQTSLTANGIEKWLIALKHFKPVKERKSLQIDYKQYGAGEAKMTWLDEELSISTMQQNAIETANALANKLYEKIRLKKYMIGHLKFLITSGQWQKKISFTSLYEPLLKQTRSPFQLNKAAILINARIKVQPEKLKQILADTIHEISNNSNCEIESKSSSVFQPQFPKPQYRIDS